MMTILEILKYIGQPIIIVGAVTYLFKTLGEYFLDKRLKAYEKELDNQRSLVEKEIDLFIAKSSRLYDDQLLTLKDLYKKLSALNREMSTLTVSIKAIKQDFDSEEKERISAAANSYNDFVRFYTENKIVFPKEMTTRLDVLTKLYYESYFEHSFGFHNKEHYHKGYTEGIKKAFDIMNEKIPPILIELEDEFRKLLGVNAR